MLPRLQAEESIQMANRVGIGTANVKDASAITAAWEETASGVVRQRQPATPGSIWGGLAGGLPGQKVILVPRKKAAPDGD